MTKQDYIKLFSQIKPGFFERDYVKNREDEDIFDEMSQNISYIKLNCYLKEGRKS